MPSTIKSGKSQSHARWNSLRTDFIVGCGGTRPFQVLDSCNVLWANYHLGEEGRDGLWGTLERLLAYFVLLFPALEATSVYPLDVIVLSNNLMAVVYRDEVGRAEQDRVIMVTFRIACSLPAVLCALLVKDLGRIVSYAGCVTVAMVFIFPAYLNIISQRMCMERFGTSWTPATREITSSPRFLWACVAFGSTLFVSVIVNDVIDFCATLL